VAWRVGPDLGAHGLLRQPQVGGHAAVLRREAYADATRRREHRRPTAVCGGVVGTTPATPSVWPMRGSSPTDRAHPPACRLDCAQAPRKARHDLHVSKRTRKLITDASRDDDGRISRFVECRRKLSKAPRNEARRPAMSRVPSGSPKCRRPSMRCAESAARPNYVGTHSGERPMRPWREHTQPLAPKSGGPCEPKRTPRSKCVTVLAKGGL
jgi:hypothetical protein